MSIANEIASTQTTLVSKRPASPPELYTSILSAYHLRYTSAGNYLQVGDITWVQGWILDISVISIEISSLLETILPILIHEDAPFRIIKNPELAIATLNGRLGLLQMGKIMTVYPKTDNQADSLSERINAATEQFRGPIILTDLKIGPVLYTRYGACNPVTRMNALGNVEEYIFDSKGQLIRDRLTIPFAPPADVTWPFRKAPEEAPTVAPSMLKGKYKIMGMLKTDARGDVMKALWMKNLFSYKWCVIKEARPNTNTDASGRDNRDRLRWQYELHNKLKDIIPLPLMYDTFEELGRTYVAMKLIKGIGLDDCIQNTYNGKLWLQLSTSQKLQLLDYALQVVSIIERMHKEGYIHRDITPVNFLITRRHQIYAIDLELTWSKTEEEPDPPFLLGTAGFISPEQQAAAPPTKEQDIYSLACTLITILTGLLPNKFAASSKEFVIKKIDWFIGNGHLASVLGHCLHSKPTSRPSLQAIKESLTEFRQKQTASSPIQAPSPDPASLIQQAIHGLVIPEMLSPEKLWHSRTQQDADYAYYQMEGGTVYYGFSLGAAGIMYVLSRAHRCGVDIGPTIDIYRRSLAYIQSQLERREVMEHRGFFTGMAGVAVALIEGLGSDLITRDKGIELLQPLFDHGNITGYGMAQGVAGEGMALLRAVGILGESFYLPKLNERVEWLLSGQQSDGSWILGVDENSRPLQVTGFSQGMAGIICFLTAFYRQYPSERIRLALIQSLQWLTSNASKREGKIVWTVHTRTKAVDSGMGDGLIGIALSYLKAYQALGDPSYRKIAEHILRAIPYPLSRRDITLEGGLTGIGELYVEAAEILGDSEWKSRAGSVVDFLAHQYCEVSGAAFWLTEEASFPTAGLVKGNAGILHFLLRYSHPKKITHPLLPHGPDNSKKSI
jgi:serine/threonine protein kinase